MEILVTLAAVLAPIAAIGIIVLVITTKLRRLTKSTLGMTPSQTMKFLGDGLKEEVNIPKPITSLSAVYSPKIERDFPDIGCSGLEAMAKNGLIAVFNAIESKNTDGLGDKSCSMTLINKVRNIIEDLVSNQEEELYNNVKVHKCGISAYNKKEGEATAVFEISLQCEFVRRKMQDTGIETDENEKKKKGKEKSVSGAKSSKTEPSLVQSAYKVTLAYDQKEYEKGTNIVFTSNCANCGAPLDISASHKVCPYCGAGYEITQSAERMWFVTDYNIIK